MKIRLITLFIIIFKLTSFSQNIQWSEIQEAGTIDRYVINKEGDLFSYRNYSKAKYLTFLPSMRVIILTHFKGSKILNEVEIDITKNEVEGKLFGLKLIKNKPTIFYQITNEGKTIIYSKEYDNQLNYKIPEKEITQFDNSDKNYIKTKFLTVQSKDSSFTGICFLKDDVRNNKLAFGYAILDSSMNKFSEGYQELKVSSEFIDFRDCILSNEGKLYVGFSEHRISKNSLLKRIPLETFENATTVQNLAFVKNILVYECGNNQTNLLNYEISKNAINKFKLISNSNAIISVVGSYKASKDNIIELRRKKQTMTGLFTFNFNFQSSKVDLANFVELPIDLHTTGLKEKNKHKIFSEYTKSGKLPILIDYKLNSIESLPNGRIIGILEQINGNEITTINNYYSSNPMLAVNPVISSGSTQTFNAHSSVHSNSTTQETYIFKDIIVFCLNLDGSLKWTSRIRKYQTGNSVVGDFTSACSFIKDDKYNFLISDNPKNYDNSGRFIENKKNHHNPFLPNKMIVSKITMDLETGRTERIKFLENQNNKEYYSPRTFIYNPVTKTLLLSTVSGLSYRSARFGQLILK